MSDWRSGGSVERLSQRTPLYSAPYKLSNPSMSGTRPQDEISEIKQWVNQYLSVGGYSAHQITDLASDLSDGITLLRLVQSLAGEQLPRHSPNPMMKVQRIENFQVLLEYLKQTGIVLNVYPEDLAGGNVKSISTVCKALKRHYTSGPSFQSGQGSKGLRSLSYSSLDKEDIAVLSWVGGMVHRNIPDYSTLYDGRVLCELVNMIKDNTLQDVEEWTGGRRLREVFSVSESHFFLPHSTINLNKVSSGAEDRHLRSFLQQLKTVHIQRSCRQTHTSTPSTHSTRPHSHSQEEVFSGLHGHSLSQELQRKEPLQSYEGLKQTRKTGSFSNLTHTSKPEALGKSPLFPPLDRHHSVDTGIAPPRPQPAPLFRSTSQTLPLHRSTESINMPTFTAKGLGRRTPSYQRLESNSGEELASHMTVLEDRLATLTAQFLFERHDMYKRMDKALVRERKRRQAVEKRLREVEGLAARLVKHYDSSIIELAKQVSVLRGELLVAQARPTPVTMEIQHLKDQVQKLSQPMDQHPHLSTHPQTLLEVPTSRKRSETLFVRKTEPEATPTQPSPGRKRKNSQPPPKPPPDNVYCRGSLTSFKKLSNFFGAEPPRLEDITTFLDGLGYSDLIQVFKSHDVSLAELAVMGDKDLDRLKIPLGPRIRILQELKKLQPLSASTVI